VRPFAIRDQGAVEGITRKPKREQNKVVSVGITGGKKNQPA
jgi:hypothetical protein